MRQLAKDAVYAIHGLSISNKISEGEKEIRYKNIIKSCNLTLSEMRELSKIFPIPEYLYSTK